MDGKNIGGEGPPGPSGAVVEAEPTARIELRCSRAWSQWLRAAASHCDLSASDFLAQSASRWAEQCGYHRGAPSRLPNRVSDPALSPRVMEHRFYGSPDTGEGDDGPQDL